MTYNWRSRARRAGESSGRRRHRHPLDGPGSVPHRQADSRRLADLATFHPQRFRPAGPERDFHGLERTGRSGGRTRSRSRPTTTAAVLCGSTGAHAGFIMSPRSPPAERTGLTIEIAGSEGSAAWDSESPNQLWLGSRQGPNQVLERDPALLSPAAARSPIIPAGTPKGFPDTFKQLYLEVYGFDRRGLPKLARAPEFPSFADGDREVRLCEAIARSTAAGWLGGRSPDQSRPELPDMMALAFLRNVEELSS